jgi:hypothetical protein
VVKRVRDAATNAVIEYTLNNAGKLIASRIAEAGRR